MVRSQKVDEKTPHRAAPRLHELDVFRGLAALAVVACHYTSECHRLGRLDFEFHWGAYGPHLFFIISGFVIAMSLSRCRRAADFAFFRFSRLYPAYWGGLAVSVLVMGWAHSCFPSQPTLHEFLGNLTMCQTWLSIADIEECYWTLGLELKFYALVILLLVLRKKEQIEHAVAVWLGAIVLYRLINSWVELPHFIGTPLILDYAHLFAAGIMFYRLRHGHSVLRHGIICGALPLGLWASGIEAMLVSAVFVATFYLFHLKLLRWLNVAPLIFLGNISYCLYLLHGSLGVAVIHGLNSLGLPTWILLAVPTLVSLVLASVLTYQLERRVLRWLRNAYKASWVYRTGKSTPLKVLPARTVSWTTSR